LIGFHNGFILVEAFGNCIRYRKRMLLSYKTGEPNH